MQHQENNRHSSMQPSRSAREEQQSLNKLMLLKRAVDKLHQKEADSQEQEMAQLLKGSKTIWEKKN